MENEEKKIEGQDIPEQIRVIREEFERQMAEQKAEFDKVIAQKDKSHVEEIKALLTGRGNAPKKQDEADDDDEDEETKMVERITEKLKKRYK